MPLLVQLPPPPVGKTGWPWTDDQDPVTGVLNDVSIPKISIVIPSYNQGDYLEETIRSVLLQRYPSLELILIDGSSKDGSVDIIRKYEPWISYWASEPDRGQSHAINKGFAKATGDWLAWLGSDDKYLPGTLLHLANLTRMFPNHNWIVGTTIMGECRGKEARMFIPRLPDPFFENQEGVKDWINIVCSKTGGHHFPQPSSFWSREAWEKAGPLEESLHYSMDYSLYCQLAYQGYVPKCVDVPLALFRRHEKQKTSHGRISFLKEHVIIIDELATRATGRERGLLLEYSDWLSQDIKGRQRKLLIKRLSPRKLLKAMQRHTDKFWN